MASPAIASVHCQLCGLPAGTTVLKGVFDGQNKLFCCHGCLHVFTILRESGALQPGVDPRIGVVPEVAGGWAGVAAGGGGAGRGGGRVDGVGAAGEWDVVRVVRMADRTHAAGRERGVVAAEVLFASDLVKVHLPQRIPGRIRERIERLGYQVADYKPGAERADDGRQRDLQLRLGVAGFVWINVMTLSSVFYVSYFEAIADGVRSYLPWVLTVLTAPAVFYSAWPILRLAGLGLRQGMLRMEALLALGILAAYGFSVFAAFSGGNRLLRHGVRDYHVRADWETAGGRGRARAARAVTLLHRMMPRKARMVEGGQERWVSVERLQSGMPFVVKAGERVPADGFVAQGHSLVNQSVITGESRPVGKTPGDGVVGGSLNVLAALTVTASQVGEDGTLAQMDWGSGTGEPGARGAARGPGDGDFHSGGVGAVGGDLPWLVATGRGAGAGGTAACDCGVGDCVSVRVGNCNAAGNFLGGGGGFAARDSH